MNVMCDCQWLTILLLRLGWGAWTTSWDLLSALSRSPRYYVYTLVSYDKPRTLYIKRLLKHSVHYVMCSVMIHQRSKIDIYSGAVAIYQMNRGPTVLLPCATTPHHEVVYLNSLILRVLY